MRVGGVLRGLRAGVFAVACVVLASLGHALMSRTSVPMWALLLTSSAVFAGAWCFTAREQGPWSVGTLTVGTQALLHGVFSLGPRGPGSQHAAGHEAAVRHHAGSMHGMGHGVTADGMTHAAGAAQDVSMTGMSVAHLLVALLSAWWLWGGERAVFRVLRAAAVRTFAPLMCTVRVVLPKPVPVVCPGGGEQRRMPRKLLLVHAIWSRGPPRSRPV